jgi:ferritin-like metal-binding protein YciE
LADLNARDLKLVQYLNEAYGKEKQLETALTADISLTTDKTYRKRLQDHLKETRNHARLLKSRIRALGGKAEEVSIPGPEAVSEVASGALNLANRAVAAAKGPAHALRGTGEQEKLLKNAKTQYWNEFEEIATYSAIETFAEVVGDRETQRLAKQIRREEERMAKFLERLIPRLAKSTAREEVPAALRNGGGRRRSSSSRSRSGGASGGGSRSNGSRSGGSRSSASSSRSAGTRAKSTAKSAAKSTRSTAKSAARTARSTAKTARTSAKAASTSAKRSRAGAKGGSARRSTAKSSGSSNGRGSSSSRTRAKSGAR